MAKPFSSRTMRPEDWAKIRHFAPTEFRRPEVMGYEFMVWLDAVREAAGVRMLISSSSRTPERNDVVGGATDSAHLDLPICDAVDVRKDPKVNWNESRMRIVTAAIRLGATRMGIYQDDSIHLDRTEHKRPAPRLWVRN